MAPLENIEDRWSPPEVSEDVSCLVYGQGRCTPADAAYPHYEKRLQLQQFLADRLGVNAALPEDVVEDDADGFLIAQVRYAVRNNIDLIVVFQPPEPERGPPTLKIELMDLYYHRIMRCRVYIYTPAGSAFTAWDEVVRRFQKDRRFSYARELYDSGNEIRDHLADIIATVAARKRDGTWPPQCAPPPEII